MTAPGNMPVAPDQLKAFVERIERLTEEKQECAEAIREVLGEAKGNGFDVKTIRAIVKIRAQDKDKRREAEEMLDLYLQAMGMLD